MTRYFGVHTLDGEWHSLLPRYLILAERVRGKKVLDIGCGTGIGSSLLLELGAAQVNAIDHRPAVLEIARLKHAKEGLDFHVMFWEELDFADDSFDIVLCLDPTSPVTDPSLLLEVKRVLRSGGEYICAIEQRNVEGLESILPRYGYTNSAENIELSRSGDRVPQLGQLTELFDSVIPVIQRPHYSYIFDIAEASEGVETRAVRQMAGTADESGLWVGAAPDKGAAEDTDQRPGRWLSQDDRLCDRDGDPAAVQLLFCGESQMAPPRLGEVKMPLLGLIERLQQLISDLQVHQQPAHTAAPFHIIDDPSVDEPPTQQFSLREETSEFYAPSAHPVPDLTGLESGPRHYEAPQSAFGLDQVQDQLEQMTFLYQQMRQEMESLFLRTRQELEQRDRYIEHLVGTVQGWQQRFVDTQEASVNPKPSFEAEPTSVFQRPIFEDEERSPDEERLDEESSSADELAPATAPSPAESEEENKLATPEQASSPDESDSEIEQESGQSEQDPAEASETD